MADVVVCCQTCAYWSRNRKPGVDNGQCRRYPPTLERSDHGLKAMWPMTELHGWCGEHAVEVAHG